MSGNGTATATCPHGCIRCRAIEMGLSGRGLTPSEFIELHGGLEDSSRHRPPRAVFSDETIEAQQAMEVAQVALEDATRELREIEARIPEERRKLRGVDDKQRQQRALVLDAGARAVRSRRGEAKAKAVEAANRYSKLARYESQLHTQRLLGAERAEARALKEAAERERATRGSKALTAIRRLMA